MAHYILHWLGGTTQHVYGDTIADAMTHAGYGAGAVRALDYCEQIMDASATVKPAAGDHAGPSRRGWLTPPRQRGKMEKESGGVRSSTVPASYGTCWIARQAKGSGGEPPLRIARIWANKRRLVRPTDGI